MKERRKKIKNSKREEWEFMNVKLFKKKERKNERDEEIWNR